MKAVTIQANKPVVKNDQPLPTLKPGFLLCKIKAVAGNPIDYKLLELNIGTEGAVLGCDAFGEIVELGEGVDKSRFNVGDYVYAFVYDSVFTNPQNGAFAEYAIIDSKVAFKASKSWKLSGKEDISADPVNSIEGAVSLPLCFITATLSLTYNYGIKLEWQPEKPQNNFPVLIWGAGSTVGFLLVQLCKQLHAYSEIIVVASKKHEKVLKSLGADTLYDYHDEDVVEQINSKNYGFQHLFDACSTLATTRQVYNCASPTKSAVVTQYNMVTVKDIEDKYRRDDVNIIGTAAFSISGEDLKFGPNITMPADLKYRQQCIELVKFFEPKILNGDIQHPGIHTYKKGLEDVPLMLSDIENQKNSGQKFVVPF
ncbi:hypothetical protein TBLA_0D01770 [Henningerozyma blattae CBS 6284]|uniref:Enoyl reductase (ER) domain-containing protein n=1 Tax=Henningerozyma blattae (strain ATCC 34711 / CBS 6284 / DSM 70876 / NBRC 10599 / NRRL Y-10934 / UCD 77-7) TaxID=1071380 RepID=I2H2T3_HENB6|nr:hypothetical protein TBLA_0D01770 [Tetrapisispora blattae CBS 6284]CCH60685.1 hypothetical protein TBLA_0D01770 [Tetrapisispora blattae CBS 6284]